MLTLGFFSPRQVTTRYNQFNPVQANRRLTSITTYPNLLTADVILGTITTDEKLKHSDVLSYRSVTVGLWFRE